MRYLVLIIAVMILSGCAGGQADKETHVIPQMTTGAITLTLPAESTAAVTQALSQGTPLIQITQTMTLSDSALKGGNQDGAGGTSTPKTEIPISLAGQGSAATQDGDASGKLDGSLQDSGNKTDNSVSQPANPTNVIVPPPKEDDSPVVVIPDPDPATGEWEVIETYTNLSSPPEIDAGRSFAWLKKGKGNQYPTQVRLSWPECNKSCIIKDTAKDYNYAPPRDGSKCVWYSGADDEFPEGSWFSDDKCTTTKGLIEAKKLE